MASANSHIEKIRHPHSHEVASLDSMALEVFTDFDEQRPLVLEQSVSVDSLYVRTSHRIGDGPRLSLFDLPTLRYPISTS